MGSAWPTTLSSQVWTTKCWMMIVIVALPSSSVQAFDQTWKESRLWLSRNIVGSATWHIAASSTVAKVLLRAISRNQRSRTWIHDAETVLNLVLLVTDKQSNRPIVIVGSSMGAWIALHLALRHKQHVIGLIGIASAPDFLQDIWNAASPKQLSDLKTQGFIYLPSEYDKSQPYPISWQLIRDAQDHWLLLDKADTQTATLVVVDCPIRLFHGQADVDVSWQKSLRLAELLTSNDVAVTLIKSGDHRLSRPQDIAYMCSAIDDLLECTG